MNIKLSAFIPIDNLSDYKLHLACWNGDEQPLDVFVRSRDDWKGWNSWRGNRDDFTRQYILSFINFYHEENLWLFGGVFEVLERNKERNKVRLLEQHQELIGRLLVSFDRPQGWRGRAFNLENAYHNLIVSELLKDTYSGETFCGYENINHDFHRLEMIFKNNKQDWRAALENIKGIYVITDKNNGKKYVGSAYGDSGIWSRWACYLGTGHGWNDELTKLIKQEGIEYARNNFRISLLEYRSMKTDDYIIMERESYWKEVLLSRGQYGYNKN